MTWVRDPIPRQFPDEQGLGMGGNAGAMTTIVHSKAKTYRRLPVHPSPGDSTNGNEQRLVPEQLGEIVPRLTSTSLTVFLSPRSALPHF